jgi:nucleotide-binding universal stress UspA family protein
MFKRILVAFDGSEHARKAATLAGNLAREQKNGTILWVVTVMDPFPQSWGEPYRSQYIEQHTGTGHEMIKEAAALIGEGVEIRRELLFGPPAQSITQVAETQDCDLIVMGTRGVGLLEGLLVGSQAQRVISNARCPVLIVK